MNHYERIIELIVEGRIKAANKAKKRGFETKEGRKVDALRRDPNPKKSIETGEAAARHSTGTKTERTRKGVEAIQRSRYRDARREGSSK